MLTLRYSQPGDLPPRPRDARATKQTPAQAQSTVPSVRSLPRFCGKDKNAKLDADLKVVWRYPGSGGRSRDMSATDDGQTLQTAHSLRRSGRLSEAAGSYRQLSTKIPIIFTRCIFLASPRQPREILPAASLKRSLSIEPPNIQLVENFATILFQAETKLRSISHAGLQFNNSSITLLYVNALALFKLDRLQEMLAQFDQLLLLQPKHVAALNERAAVLAGMNRRYDEALASVENALRRRPALRPGAFEQGRPPQWRALRRSRRRLRQGPGA